MDICFGLQAGSVIPTLFGQQKHSWRWFLSPAVELMTLRESMRCHGERGAGQGTELTLLCLPWILLCRELGFSKPTPRDAHPELWEAAGGKEWSMKLQKPPNQQGEAVENIKHIKIICTTQCTPLVPSPQLCSFHLAAEMFGLKQGCA